MFNNQLDAVKESRKYLAQLRRFWVDGGGGLYRYDGKSFVNGTKNGPWE